MSVSDERLAAFARMPSDVLSLLDRDGNIIYVSPSVTRTLGYTAEEYMAGGGGMERIHLDDRELMRAAWIRALASPDEEQRVEVRVTHKDGAERWLDVLMINRLDDPELAAMITNFRDVTERRLAVDALRASEERFRTLVQDSSDVVVVLDREYRVTWVSDSVRRSFGQEPESLLGFQGLDMIHPDDATRVAEEIVALYHEPDAHTLVEYRAPGPDGEYRWLELTARNLYDNPVVAGMVLNIRDVTDRHTADDAVIASQKRLDAVLQNTHDVTAIISADTTIMWVTDGVRELLGYEPDELAGRSGLDLIHPDDRSWVIERLAALGTAQSMEGVPFTIRMADRDGAFHHIDLVGTDMLEEPGVNGIVITMRNVDERMRAEQALRASEELFRTITESSPTGIYQQTRDEGCVFVNERWQQITGLTFAQAKGHGWVAMVHPEDRAMLGLDDEPQLPQGPVEGDFRVQRPDGEVRWVHLISSPVTDADGTVTANVGALEDITDRVIAQRDSSRLLSIFDVTDDLVGMAAADGTLLYLNRAARRFMDVDEDEPAMFVDLPAKFPPWVMERLAIEIFPLLEIHQSWSGELALSKPDGSIVPVSAQLLAHRDDAGDIEFFSAVLRDMSERKAFEDRLEHQATHDPLTGLPNRTLLLDRLQVALARGRRHGTGVAVLFLDVDHFKLINDSLGHGVGDKLLALLGNQLRYTLRPGDTVARFGGDEFVVLCEDLETEDDAITLAEKVTDAVTGQKDVDGVDVYVGVSMGIAYSPESDGEAESLIRDADAAMYRAKEKGRSRFEFFDHELRAHVIDRLDIENSLRRALERRELRVHYQPKVSLTTGKITGVEALVRWEHPERGLLPPGAFITVAEETGLIVPIGTWVLEQACRQILRWAAELPDLGPLHTAVNLSGRQLTHPDLVADVAEVLSTTGIDPKLVELEITESVLMDDAEASGATLRRLKELEVSLSVDDFGTGYSSLAYLRRFPVNRLKVDRSFVDGLGADAGDSAIVAAVVNLAHTLGMDSVAEGVETQVQLDALRELGCDVAQGYFIARPLTAEVLAELLATNPTW